MSTTTVPLSPDVLKKIVVDETYRPFIDVTHSPLKGQPLLTYLNNVGIDLPFLFGNIDEKMMLAKAYMESGVMFKHEQLLDIVRDILLTACGYHTFSGDDYSAALKDKDFEPIIRRWLVLLGSLSVYALTKTIMFLYTVNINGDEFQIDEDKSNTGINFIHFLEDATLPLIIDTVPSSELKFFPYWFTEPVFKGLTLEKLWESPGNPLFVASLNVKNPVDEELIRDYEEKIIDALKDDFQ